MNRLFFLILLFAFLLPIAAHAQCTNPPAEMGVLIMNKQHKVMQYCNGDDWIGLWGGRGGGESVPAGAVMAFDLTDCPSGWSEYTQARGRFLRGIDNGAGNDPDGTRAPGSVQADELKSHTHLTGQGGNGSTAAQAQFLRTDVGNTRPTSATGGPETRPKNVAVLFCRKD